MPSKVVTWLDISSARSESERTMDMETAAGFGYILALIVVIVVCWVAIHRAGDL